MANIDGNNMAIFVVFLQLFDTSLITNPSIQAYKQSLFN